MPSYSKPEVVLVNYRFSDLTGAKVRPAVVVSASHVSQDLFIVPLTSKTDGLLAGEFALVEWKKAGLNIETAVKRGWIPFCSYTGIWQRVTARVRTEASTRRRRIWRI